MVSSSVQPSKTEEVSLTTIGGLMVMISGAGFIMAGVLSIIIEHRVWEFLLVLLMATSIAGFLTGLVIWFCGWIWDE